RAPPGAGWRSSPIPSATVSVCSNSVAAVTTSSSIRSLKNERAGTLLGPPPQWLNPLLNATDVRRLQPLRTLHHLELDPLTLAQGPKPFRDDRRVMDEHVRRTVARNEAKPLRIVEPLHSTLFHDHTLLPGDLVDTSCRFLSASRRLEPFP